METSSLRRKLWFIFLNYGDQNIERILRRILKKSMKNKLMKYWGIIIVLAVLAGLLVPAMPVSAGPLAWTNQNVPNAINNQLIAGTVNTYVNAPDGKTIFAYDNTARTLYKSVDGGITFITSGIGSVLNGNNSVVALALTTTYATDLTVVAITKTPNQVFRSQDGGATFSSLGIPVSVGAASLTSVSVVNNYFTGGQAILVGYATGAGGGGVAIYTTAGWTDLTTSASSSAAPTVIYPTIAAAPIVGATTLAVNATNAAVTGGATLVVLGGTTPEVVTVTLGAGTTSLTLAAPGVVNATHVAGSAVIPVTASSTLSGPANAGNGAVIINVNPAFVVGTSGVAVIGAGLPTQQFVNYTVAAAGVLTLTNGQTIAVAHVAGEIVAIVGGTGAVVSAASSSWTTVLGTAVAGLDVEAVAFSPTYTADAGIIVVASSTAHTYLRYKLGNQNWDASVVPAQIDNVLPVTAGGTLIADLAFPSDFGMFAPANVAYVALSSGAGANVYRVNASSLGGSSISNNLYVTGSGAAFNAASVAFLGPAATGTLVAGSAAITNAVIYTTTNSYTSAPTWSPAITNPSGCGPVIVNFSPTSNATKYTLYAGTNSSGAPGNTASTHGGLFTSTDSLHFVGVSLLNVFSLSDIRISGFSLLASANKAWVFIRDWSGGPAPTAGDNTMLFNSTDGGNTWTEIYSHVSVVDPTTSGVAAIPPMVGIGGYDYPLQLMRSPTYATDNTLFLRFNIAQIWKSTDNGLTWYGASTPNGLLISSITLIDVNTYWVAAANGTGIYKSGFTTGVNLNGEIPVAIIPFGATDIWVTTWSGSIWRSQDSGVTYNTLGQANFFKDLTGALTAPGLSFDAAYATNKTIYSSSGNTVYRWVIDTNVTWDTITPATGLVNSLGVAVPINGLSVSADDTMYINTTSSNGSTAYAPYYRNASPNMPLSLVTLMWQAMPSTGFVGAASPGPFGMYNTGVQNAASNTFYQVVRSAVAPSVYLSTVPTTQNGYPTQLLTFQDTLVQAPVIVGPAAKAQVETPITLSWTALPNTGGLSVTYQVMVATDPLFAGLVIGPGTANPGTTPGTSYFVPGSLLNPGTTYYWMVSASVPMNSKAGSSSFSVVLAQGGNTLLTNGLFSPAIGATNVVQKPVFQWAAIAGAVSYDFQVADNPVFVNPIDAQTGLNTTVWTETKTMDYGKTYYWRVRAVSASGVASDWANSSFTVMAAPSTALPVTTAPVAPVVVPTITVNIPTQAVPTYTITIPPASTTPPSTPASIWVLIVIGAILIIAVIVLIVRTRRA
jgi:hypothetical protein